MEVQTCVWREVMMKTTVPKIRERGRGLPREPERMPRRGLRRGQSGTLESPRKLDKETNEEQEDREEQMQERGCQEEPRVGRR